MGSASDVGSVERNRGGVEDTPVEGHGGVRWDDGAGGREKLDDGVGGDVDGEGPRVGAVGVGGSEGVGGVAGGSGIKGEGADAVGGEREDVADVLVDGERVG